MSLTVYLRVSMIIDSALLDLLLINSLREKTSVYFYS